MTFALSLRAGLAGLVRALVTVEALAAAKDTVQGVVVFPAKD